MSPFHPGQRWISDTETEFGIGTVVTVDARTVSVQFRAVMETRVYAIHSAPLSRVRFEPGNQVHDIHGHTITVEALQEDAHGVITYRGVNEDGISTLLPEADIDHHLPVHEPDKRLLMGQVDDPRWFTLRLQARQYEGQIWQSPVRGLQGARMELVPHQLYIADQVSRRSEARALLADEVGLGKTIEACLILHRRHVQGQCERALIIVPPSLVNQWLVELLRRFNLSFSVYDEQRCQHIEESEPGCNPFEHAQLILTSLELLTRPERLEQALSQPWDMLVIDEAHHLHWHETQPGEDYLVAEVLASHIPSVLLLTATPEQLGIDSHFARLRLLDPDRFHDLARFKAEEAAFEPLADLAERVLNSDAADDALLAQLNAHGVDTDAGSFSGRQAALARQLVDLHGTSRLLFRNTRQHIQGFPERRLHEHPLQATTETANSEFTDAVFDQLLQADPRLDWLSTQVRTLRPEKILLICARADTALQLQEQLRHSEGIRCSVFHEAMSIIQRDRAAAWFADPDGADVLLCSEIGSEGRNFQFAHHLILFDLPLNPDLLEQRIGRLDRIGQRETIHIHVPWIQGTASEALFRWYAQVTRLFRQPDPAAAALFEDIEDEWRNILKAGQPTKAFIGQCQQRIEALQQQMAQGRERLLSLSSFDEAVAGRIAAQIRNMDADPALQPFMEQAFDLFGVDVEEHSHHRQVVRPGDHMIGGHFPHVADDGTLITFDRTTALAHEDTQFLSWDHPMVSGAIDMVGGGEFGNSALSVIHHDELPAGTSLLEMLYVIDCPAPAWLPLRRYIRDPVVRLLLDSQGRDLTRDHPHAELTEIAMQVDKLIARQAIRSQAQQIEAVIRSSRDIASKRLASIRQDAQQTMCTALDSEIARLRNLKQRNPNIDEAEITLLEEQRDAMHRLLEKAQIRLDALRLIVVGD